jgi:hypothetical protein
MKSHLLQTLHDLELRYPALAKQARTASIQALEKRKMDAQRDACKAQVIGIWLPEKAVSITNSYVRRLYCKRQRTLSRRHRYSSRQRRFSSLLRGRRRLQALRNE